MTGIARVLDAEHLPRRTRGPVSSSRTRTTSHSGREIRADARYRTLPVILITGSDTESVRIRHSELAVDNDIAKPVSLDELSVWVRAQLNARPDERREHQPQVHDQRQEAEPASVNE